MIPCFTYFLLWPFGRFIKYTQGHPVMAIRPFHKVYLRPAALKHCLSFTVSPLRRTASLSSTTRRLTTRTK